MSERIDFLLTLQSNKPAEVASMLKFGTIDVNEPMRGGGSPLQAAAGLGRVEIAELMLNAGARINDADKRGDTALHLAIANRQPAVAELLIARGADLNVRNDQQRTPLALAVLQKSDRATLALIRGGASLEDRAVVLQVAAMSVAALQLLKERNVEIGALVEDETPLHVAARRVDDAELVRALVRAGVQRNAIDRNGATAVHFCASSGFENSLRALIENGAEFDLADGEDLTPLHYACGSSKNPCVRLLLAAGANVDVRDRSGQTPAHFAASELAMHGSADIVHALVAAGADLDAADHEQGVSVRQSATLDAPLSPGVDERAAILANLAVERCNLLRPRALQICIGLQSLGLDALQTIEILLHACGPGAPLAPFHWWWAIVTTVKHHSKGS